MNCATLAHRSSKNTREQRRNSQICREGGWKQNERLANKPCGEHEGEANSKSCLPTVESRVKVVPKWSDVFGNRKAPTNSGVSKSPVTERPQEPLRKAPRGGMKPAVFKALRGGRTEVPEKMPPPLSAMSTHELKVDTICRTLKTCLSIRRKKLMDILEACSMNPVGANMKQRISSRLWS